MYDLYKTPASIIFAVPIQAPIDIYLKNKFNNLVRTCVSSFFSVNNLNTFSNRKMIFTLIVAFNLCRYLFCNLSGIKKKLIQLNTFPRIKTDFFVQK